MEQQTLKTDVLISLMYSGAGERPTWSNMARLIYLMSPWHFSPCRSMLWRYYQCHILNKSPLLLPPFSKLPTYTPLLSESAQDVMWIYTGQDILLFPYALLLTFIQFWGIKKVVKSNMTDPPMRSKTDPQSE